MKRYIFVENNVINGAGGAPLIKNDNALSVEVSEDIYQEFVADPLKYVYTDGQIIPNPNYESDNQKRQNKTRANEIYEELAQLDSKRVRALCENSIKDESTGESWLDYYNNQITQLREELRVLLLNI